MWKKRRNSATRYRGHRGEDMREWGKCPLGIMKELKLDQTNEC